MYILTSSIQELYTKSSVWNFAAAYYGLAACRVLVLPLAHEVAQQWEGHAHQGLFFPTLFFPKLLLFRSNPCLSSFHAIIRAHFLLIWLQQYFWNRDKHLLAPNPETNTTVLQTLASASLVILYGFPCLRVTKFPSLLCSAFLIGDPSYMPHGQALQQRVPLVLVGRSAEAGSNIELRANSTKPCVFYYILLSGL